jgi:Tfp pilus assembly protein PilN
MTAAVYQQINLYQPIFRRQRQVFSASAMLQATGVVAVALLLIYAYGLWQVTSLEAEAVQLEGREKAYAAQLAGLDPTSSQQRRSDIERQVAELNARLIEQQKLVEVLRSQPLGGTSGFSAHLTALARRHLDGLWLTKVRIRGAAHALDLTGKTVRPDLVPDYLVNLGKEEALAGQKFGELKIERSEDGAEISFSVSSRLDDAADEPAFVAQR